MTTEEKKFSFKPGLILPVKTSSPTINILHEEQHPVEQEQTRQTPFGLKLNLQNLTKNEKPNSQPDSGRSQQQDSESPGSKSDRSSKEGESFDVSKLRLNLQRSPSGNFTISNEPKDTDSGSSSTANSSVEHRDEEEKKPVPKLSLNLGFKQLEKMPSGKPSPTFGVEIDSPASSESDRNDDKKHQSPTIGFLKRPLGIKIPLRDEQIGSPVNSTSDRGSRDKKKNRKVRVDLLLGDFCTDFDTESKPTKEEIRQNIDLSLFGEEKNDTMDFEYYSVRPIHDQSGSPTSFEHIACKPSSGDFSVKLLKHLMYENRALRIKLDKSGKAISSLSEDKTQLQNELKRVQQESNASEMESLRAKVATYEKLRVEVLKQLEYLKSQQEQYEDGSL